MWIYARSGELWVKQAELSHPIGKGKPGELEATEFGEHIAVSGDGKTAVVSDSAANKGKGAIFVYTRVGETWSQQAELRGTPVSGKGVFCQALAISVDGSTIVAGGPYDHGKRGSIWVFTRSGETWSQQGPRISPPKKEVHAWSFFGQHVAISGDGNTIVAHSGNTAHSLQLTESIYVYTRSGETWTITEKLPQAKAIKTFGLGLSEDGDVMLASEGKASTTWTR